MDSSSDEDVDILLRTASDKLGWSSKRNSEDTLQMLRRNVEDSKKKASVTSRRRRQTPRAHSKSAASVPDNRLTSKRILSFKVSSPAPPLLQSESSGDELDNDCRKLLGSLKLAGLAQQSQRDGEQVRRNHASRGHQNLVPKTSSLSASLSNGRPGLDSLPNVMTSMKCSVEEDGSTESWTRGGRPTGVAVDGSGDSKDLNRSWVNYREPCSEKQTSSDSEDAGEFRIEPVPAVTLSHSDEDSSDPPSPLTSRSSPPSLSKRLLKNFQDKKSQGQRDGDRLSEEGAAAVSSENRVNTSSDDDDFETFLQKMKTPQKMEPVLDGIDESDEDDFINDGAISEGEEREEEEPLFYYQQDNEGLEDGCLVKTPPSRILTDQTNTPASRVIVLSSSSDDDNVFITPVKPKHTGKTRGKPKLSNPPDLCTPKTPVNKLLDDKKRTFLKSLDTPPINVRPESPFVKNFKKRKVELTANLFAMYNKTVFDSKLPSDMQVLWNKRMRKTAGYCVYTKIKFKGTRDVRIELSEKVCDTAERLRDTLIHEMCHAACWLINGVNDGHGRFWKYWATKANLAHPDLPPIRRCHSYEITTKFKYQCQQCKSTVGRHSKSLDVAKKCCGICKGRFVLLPTTNGKENKKKQQPNKFAMFVKENYATIKKSNDCFKHADVMRMLSQEFSRKASLDN